MVFCGLGPAEEKLRQELLPDAQFLGWKSENELSEIYSAAIRLYYLVVLIPLAVLF